MEVPFGEFPFDGDVARVHFEPNLLPVLEVIDAHGDGTFATSGCRQRISINRCKASCSPAVSSLSRISARLSHK